MTVRQGLLAILAVFVVYLGGFAYDELGPGVYALFIVVLASTPLLIKLKFWKKIILFLPLLLLRAFGKVVLKLYGKSALTLLMRRYGLLEQRYKNSVDSMLALKDRAAERLAATSSLSRGYLVLIFLPLGIVLLLLALVIKLFRLRLLQMLAEKLITGGLTKVSAKMDVEARIEQQLKRVKKLAPDSSKDDSLATDYDDISDRSQDEKSG